MESQPVRVLLVEDDEDDYFLTRDLLSEIQGQRFRLEWVKDYDTALEAMGRNGHDVYLLDYWLGQRNGLELLRGAREGGCQGPIILLTGQGEREVDIEAMRAGAADFLIKGRIDAALLERSLRYAIERQRDRKALRQAHDHLEERVKERTVALESANEALRDREEALREAHRRKDEFLAMLAHELRNPLAPIRNSLQILKMSRVDAATAQKTMEIMERQVHQLVRLVDDLLDVSRVMRGKIELRKEPVELATVLARAVETAKPLIEVQGHQLDVSVPQESLLLDADPVRLAQVIGNLLTNSAKYTEANGHIWLTARRDGAQAVLSVGDTGIGIAPDMLPHVFDLFVQADHASTKAQGGLGIGLTLVKNLVEMHKGMVEARSEGLGKGSEFLVRLPLVTQEGLEPGEMETDRQPPIVSGHRLLVVDDNQDAALSLALLLRLQGHDVQVAHDGPTALQLAVASRPDLVFLDIGMPGMDGYEVARRLRRTPGLEKVVLAALTGWGQQEDRRRTAEAGFDHHLVKPPEPKVLDSLLSTLASRKTGR